MMRLFRREMRWPCAILLIVLTAAGVVIGFLKIGSPAESQPGLGISAVRLPRGTINLSGLVSIRITNQSDQPLWVEDALAVQVQTVHGWTNFVSGSKSDMSFLPAKGSSGTVVPLPPEAIQWRVECLSTVTPRLDRLVVWADKKKVWKPIRHVTIWMVRTFGNKSLEFQKTSSEWFQVERRQP